MNIINRTIQKVHQISGIVIALFFAMWLVSGIVLLYHRYPRVGDKDIYHHTQSLQSAQLPGIYELPGMTDTTRVKTLSVSNELGATTWTIRHSGKRKNSPMDSKPAATGGKYILAGDTLIARPAVSGAQLDSIARLWAGAGEIIGKDTLTERCQWVLYERYENDLPIIRYRFNNPEKSEIFISQNSGEVLQSTTKSQRLWSYFGAIPHKLYIPALRRNVEAWKTVLLIGGLLCLIAALSGIYIGVYYLIINRRKHHSFSSPFRRRMWRCHHIAGLAFGIFLLAWGVSGTISMQKVPKWMVNYDEYSLSTSKFWGKKGLKLKDYRLDYRDILNAYPEVKSISWEHFGNMPVYHIVSGEKEYYVDASEAGTVAPMEIPEEQIRKAVEKYYGEDTEFTMTRMDEYDEYYLSSKSEYPLPVWKIEVDDPDGTRLYVSPATGYVKYYNENRMVRKWLFSASHYLEIKYFVLHKTLRLACLWIMCVGCIFVILTGIAIFVGKEKSKFNRKSQTGK